MKVFMIPQISDEWWTVRRAVPTASEFDKIITPAKGDLSTQADDYIAELIADYACLLPNYFTTKGTPTNSYAIQQGKDLEPEARRWLSMEMNCDVQEVGFCMTDDFRFGCSPDFVIGLQLSAKPTGEWQGVPYFDGTCEEVGELKVPLLHTHAKYLMKGTLPREYRCQVHGHLLVTGAKRARFCSYSVGELPSLQMVVEPDDFTTKLKGGLDQFWENYQAVLAKFR